MSETKKKPIQPEIIEYLVENEKVYELAKTIITQGYFLNEQPIVFQEDGKYIVLEGNRRVGACKLLINPDLLKSINKKLALKKALKGFDLSIITKIDVIIAPNRESADIMIVNRHTGGSVVEKWDKTKQDRFLHNRKAAGETIDELSNKFSMAKSDIKGALQRYNMFVDISKIEFESSIKDVLQQEVKFSMTNFERVYDSKHGRDFLGIDFTNEGELIRKLPRHEYEKRLKVIVEKVVNNEINSRSLNTDDQKRTFIANLLNSSQFDKTIELDEKYQQEYPKDNSIIENIELPDEISVKKKSVSSTKLFMNSLHFITGISRMDDIFNEIKSLNLKNHPNAIAVLLRSYLDMVTYQFLKKNGALEEMKRIQGVKLQEENDKTRISLNQYLSDLGVSQSNIDTEKLNKLFKIKGSLNKDFVPSLMLMLEYLASSDLLLDVKLKVVLKSHLNKNSKVEKVIGHNEFNLLVHNEYYSNDPIELQSVWSKLEPVLDYMVINIKK